MSLQHCKLKEKNRKASKTSQCGPAASLASLMRNLEMAVVQQRQLSQNAGLTNRHSRRQTLRTKLMFLSLSPLAAI